MRRRLLSWPRYQYLEIYLACISYSPFIHNPCWRCFTEAQKTHTHTQPFYGSLDFVRDNLGEPVPEETFTHSHPSWSSNIPICFPHLLRCMASSLFNPCTLQSFSTISKFSVVYLLAWHPPLHTPYISSPSCYLLFAAHAYTIATCFAVVPRLCHLILVCLSTL